MTLRLQTCILLAILLPGVRVLAGDDSAGGEKVMVERDEEVYVPSVQDENRSIGWLDRWQLGINNYFQGQVQRLDRMMAEDPNSLMETPESRFFFGFEMEAREEGGFKLKPNFRGDMDIGLPNLERWAQVTIGTEDESALPGTPLSEQNQKLEVGLQNTRVVNEKWRLRTKLALRAEWPPVYIREEAIREWKGETWNTWLTGSGFYRAKDGFGTRNSILWQRWATERLMARASTGMVWSERSQGVEWSVVGELARLGQVFVKRQLRERDVHRGLVLEGSVFGHKSGSGIVDGYRTAIIYRLPIYKRFVYMNIAPDARWYNERDWKLEPGLTLGFDMMFWGERNR